MKIGYEAKRAFLNKTGLGNYSRGVISIMASYYPENRYYLYTPELNTNINTEFAKGRDQVKTVTPKSIIFKSLWRSRFVVKALKRDQIELYHGLSHELPVGIKKSGIKSVVTIHDLIFMRFPKYFNLVNRVIYATKIKYACKNADKIIAVSERTKLDLVELLNIDPAKIEVIYQGCDALFKIKQSYQKKAEVKTKYSLPDNFILYVGTVEERKNLFLLTNAFRSLPNNTQLVVVGKHTNYAINLIRILEQYGLADRVTFLQNVGFADLPAIYQLADVFVYPSRYEGFGIPVLEALVSGTPVIAATGSCLEEAGGPDSLYVDPDDEIGLAEKLREVLASKTLQNNMIENGLKYAERFEDKILAGQLMRLYTNTLTNA